MNVEESNSEHLHPLAELLIPIVALGFAVAFYLVLSAASGNVFNPFRWHPATLMMFSYTMIGGVVAAVLLFYFGREGRRIEEGIGALTDLGAYEGMKALDALLTHYTNVATVGLLLSLLIYAGRYVAIQAPSITAIVVAVIFVSIIFLYGVLLMKLAKGLATNHKLTVGPYLVCTGSVFFVDTIALSFFVSAASSLPHPDG